MHAACRLCTAPAFTLSIATPFHSRCLRLSQAQDVTCSTSPTDQSSVASLCSSGDSPGRPAVCVWGGVHVCFIRRDIHRPQAKTMSPSSCHLPLIVFVPAHSLNRLAGSWGGWRRRPGKSTLSLSFGPTGRDCRYPAGSPQPGKATTESSTHHPSSSSTTVFFSSHSSELVSAHRCNHTSAHNGIVVNHLLVSIPEVPLPSVNL